MNPPKTPKQLPRQQIGLFFKCVRKAWLSSIRTSNIKFTFSARVANIPCIIVETALPKMPRKHSAVNYDAAMLQDIGRAAAQREEDTVREQGELVRVICLYFPAP